MASLFTLTYLKEVVTKHIPVLDHSSRRLIQSAIEERLTTDPIGYGKPLQYSLKGHRRLRVGDWRVVYRIEESKKNVLIIAIKHRKDIYEGN